MKGLTQAQSEILAYIKDFIAQHRFSPSYSEIQNHFGFASVNAVTKHLNALKRKGILHAEAKCSRSLALTSTGETENQYLPLIGTIVAGQPLTVFATPVQIAIPLWLVQDLENSYLIKAQGDSLQDELIADGDLLIVAAQMLPKAGSTIVALANENEALVSQYYFEGSYAKLVSRNKNYQPMILRMEDIEIQGVVTGCLRNYI